MRAATALLIGAISLIPGSPTRDMAPHAPVVTMDLWQGVEHSANYHLTYLSSVLLENIQVDGMSVSDGTPMELWTLPISVTGVPSKKIGECAVSDGKCIMPIAVDTSVDGKYAASIYLPTYNNQNGKAQLLWGWSGNPCQ